MKKFTKNDESFVCLNCKRKVELLGYSSRNHCPHCLYSLHVDIMPGDRASQCGGLMIPQSISLSAKKGQVITHKCLKCKTLKNNKTAEDDNQLRILELMKKG